MRLKKLGKPMKNFQLEKNLLLFGLELEFIQTIKDL